MVNADGLNILAETLCQLYRSAHARFVTFDLILLNEATVIKINSLACLKSRRF